MGKGNPFSVEGRWYKSALHVHTTESDGALPPGEMVRFHASRGYQLVCVTDHGGASHAPPTAEGCPGVEVYNTGCDVEKARGYSEVHWDYLLGAGGRVRGIAVDDSHHIPLDAGRAWTNPLWFDEGELECDR